MINRFLIRFSDIVFSMIGLVFCIPFFIIFAILIKLDSRGNVFFFQERVGLNSQLFMLIKFRTMRTENGNTKLITVGSNDSRITRIGKFLRRFKIDELPQLLNVLKGEMSIVGPRPEVEKYVKLYSEDQLKVLSIRPGITDYASIKYSNENDILGGSEDPEAKYVEEIIPDKIALNMEYISKYTYANYLRIIFLTLKKIA